MLNNSEIKYVWAVEWNNPFAQPDKGIVLSDVTLLPGATEEAFEKFVAEEGFPAVEGILTRAVQFGHQYLLKYAKDEGSDPLGSIQREAVAEKLKALCKHITETNFYVVMRSATAAGEPQLNR